METDETETPEERFSSIFGQGRRKNQSITMTKKHLSGIWGDLRSQLDPDSEVPIYKQLAEFLEKTIEQQLWVSSDKLPSVRELSETLKISKNTVSSAYEYLAEDGYILLEPRKKARINNEFGAGRTAPNWYELSQPHISVISPVATHHERKKLFLQDKVINLSHRMDVTWDKGAGVQFIAPYAQEAFKNLAKGLYQNVYDEQGFFDLRVALSEYLRSTFGIICGPEEILICSRRMQIYNLLSEVFLSPNIYAGLEKISFLNFYRVGISRVARRVYLKNDEHGLDISPLKAIHGSRFLFIQPTHSEPCGTVTDETRRKEILSYCSRHGIVIIEDAVMDPLYESENRPPAPLKSMDSSESVIYLGGIHGPLTPGLSLDWVVASPSVIHLLLSAIRREAQFPTEINQLILYEILKKGKLTQYFRQQSQVMDQLRKPVDRILKSYLGDIAEWNSAQCFGRIWLVFRDPIRVSVLYKARQDIDFFPGSLYGDDSDQSVLLYIFGDSKIFEQGIRRLRELIDRLFF
jgi:GntR family transcriptional regulator of abcA and norABC